MGLGWAGSVFSLKENFFFIIIRDLRRAGGDGCGPRFFFNFKLYWTITRRMVEIVWGGGSNCLWGP